MDNIDKLATNMNKSSAPQVFENPLATFWFEEEEIMRAISKPVVRTLENAQALVRQVKEVTAGKKVYALINISEISEIKPEARDYFKKEFPGIFKAIAYVTKTEISKLIGTVLSLVFDPVVPTKVFNTEAEATDWLHDLMVHGETILPKEPSKKRLTGEIIFVDDQPGEEAIMKYALAQGNWKVSMKFFTDAEKALEYLKKTMEEIFLIISDISMPKMNGFDFKKIIDANPALLRKSIPFIYVTNSSEKKDIEQAYDNKVQGYFQKPVDIDEASRMLDKIFNYWLVSKHPYKNSY